MNLLLQLICSGIVITHSFCGSILWIEIEFSDAMIIYTRAICYIFVTICLKNGLNFVKIWCHIVQWYEGKQYFHEKWTQFGAKWHTVCMLFYFRARLSMTAPLRSTACHHCCVHVFRIFLLLWTLFRCKNHFSFMFIEGVPLTGVTL